MAVRRQHMYATVCCNCPCAPQVNSKGYKVCGEASSVCGTITINKRKVGFPLTLKHVFLNIRKHCGVRMLKHLYTFP